MKQHRFCLGNVLQREKEPAFYNVQKIVLNDKDTVDNAGGYTPSTRFFINSPLWYFIDIKNNNSIDPTVSFLQLKLKQHYVVIQPYEHIFFNDSSRINAFLS